MSTVEPIAPGIPGAMVFPQDAPTAHVSPARRRFGAALAVATVFLIFAGAQVKSHQAGLSVPDWPKSFDMWWPPMVGNVFYEHGHRVIAATVGFLTLLMALWTWRAESRASVRRLAWCCLGAVIAQGLLGGLTVKWLLPPPVSIAHALLAQTFLCLTVALAYLTSREWGAATGRAAAGAAPPRRGSAARLCGWATGAVFVQLLLGALMRHTESGLAVRFFPVDEHGALWPASMTPQVAIHMVHRGFALVVLAAVLAAGTAAWRAVPRLRGHAALVALLVLGQVALGASIIWTARTDPSGSGQPVVSPIPASLHVATGASLLALVWLLALRTRRLGAGGTAGSGTPRLDLTGFSSLIRPRIQVLVLAEAAAGFLVERPASQAALPWLLLGTLLCSAAGCALNHYLERDTDARMERTRIRPLVSGALSPATVLAGGVVALLAGLALLVAGCGWLVAALQAFAALVYLGVYTPLKRRTSTNTWIGAIPGALPLLAGGVAAAGGVTQLSLLLFGLIFLWQLPHFFAIASIYREQYRAGGLRMLSGDDPGDALLRWQLPVLVMSVVLLSVGPVLAGPAGGAYAICALLLGGAFLWSAWRFRRQPDRGRARGVVLTSVAYLPLVLGALVVDVACIGRGSGAGASGGASASAQPGADGAAGAAGLPTFSELPEFALVDQDGRPLHRADLLGRTWVVDFIFTSCAGACVPMTSHMTDLQKEELGVSYLSISVDPERDTPEKLAGYREKWKGEAGRWTLAVGSREDVLALANQAFKLPAGREASTPDGLPELFHSQKFALLDGQGRVRGYYDSTDDLSLAQLRKDIARLADR
jgi:protoheme IX farnesyltransferase